jgi:hypothetical protein
MSAHLAQTERVSIDLLPTFHRTVRTSLLVSNNGVGTMPSHAPVVTHPSICLGWNKEAMRYCHGLLLALGTHVFPSISEDLKGSSVELYTKWV